MREELGMFQQVGDRLDVRMRISNVLRYPPALHAAVGQGRAYLNDAAFLGSLLDHIRKQVNPGLWRDVRLTLFGHGGDGRNSVADRDFGVAAVSFVENDLVEIGDHLGALPVHAGDGDVAAIRRIGDRGTAEQAERKTCRCEQAFHYRSLCVRHVFLSGVPREPAPNGARRFLPCGPILRMLPTGRAVRWC